MEKASKNRKKGWRGKKEEEEKEEMGALTLLYSLGSSDVEIAPFKVSTKQDLKKLYAYIASTETYIYLGANLNHIQLRKRLAIWDRDMLKL